MNPDGRTRGQAHERPLEAPLPYWQDAATVARYPFKGTNGAAIGGFAIVAALTPVPVVGLFAALFLMVAIPKHALEVLRESAHGHREPPAFGIDVGDRAAFVFVALLVAAFLAHVALSLLAPAWAAPAWRAGVALLLPLVAMSLAIDERMGRALNPVFWGHVLARIGPAYLGAAALIAVALALGIRGAGWLEAVLPPYFGRMVAMAAALWATFAAAHVAGRLVLQHGDALGFTPTGPEQPDRLRHSRDHRLEDEFDGLMAMGDASAARRLLELAQREHAISNALHQRYRQRLRADGDTPALLAHGRQWLHQRVVEGDARAALSLLHECLDLDPRFTPLDPADWAPLLAAAERAGLPRLVEAARAAQSGARPPSPDPG